MISWDEEKKFHEEQHTEASPCPVEKEVRS